MAAQQDQSKLYLVIGGLLLIYIAGNKIFQKVGLTKSPEEKEKEQQQQQVYQAQLTEQYFDPDYYKSRMKVYKYVRLWTASSAKSLCVILYNAKGIPYLTNDDEDAVYGVFKQCSAKTQVSQLSQVFYEMYKKDLKSYLQSFLNKDEFGNVLAICNRMIEGVSNDNVNWK